MDKWIWIVQLIITIIIGVIAYFLKETKNSIDKDIQDNKKDIQENKTEINTIRKEFNDFKENMPFHFVLRDDFIRSITNIDKKLDKIYDTIALTKKGSE